MGMRASVRVKMQGGLTVGVPVTIRGRPQNDDAVVGHGQRLARVSPTVRGGDRGARWTGCHV